MKKIVSLFTVLVTIITFSCSPDNVENRPVIQATDAPVLVAPDAGNAYKLSNDNKDLQAERFVWSAANYGGDVEITYTLYMDNTGGDFTNATVLGGTKAVTQISITQEALNAAALALGAQPFSATSFDIKVVSEINGMEPMESGIVTINVVPYTTEAPKIAVPGNQQGWDPGSADILEASAYGETDYEGYVWLDGEHKFIAPDDNGNFQWGNIDWGDDGTFTGLLLEDGEVNCNAPAAGQNFVQVNTGTLTYSETKYDWGIIGSATPTGWDSDTNMTYDSSSQTWTITMDLIAGEIKFRANDGWDWNYGDTGADGVLDNGGDNIQVAEAGNYTIVLDLSTPRNYTYSLTKN